MRNLLRSLALGLLALPAAAQCYNSALGTPLANGGPDYVYPITSIGFAFPLAGTTYTDIHVTTKAMCYLSNAGVPAPGLPDYDPTAAELVGGPPRLCALWNDMQPSATGLVYVNATATQCTITWKNWQSYGIASPLFDIQMQLLPSGEIYCIYGPTVTNNSTYGLGQVGIAGASPGGGATLPTASNLSAGGATTSNTIYEQWSTVNTFDMAGNTLHLIPTTPGWVYQYGVPAGCASTTSYGTGCLTVSDSFGEQWPMGSFDLQNTTWSWLRTGAGYVIVSGIAGTFVTPGPGAVTVAPGLLDGQQQFTLSTPMPIAGGNTTTLNVCTKGFITPAPVGTIDWSPTFAELLAATQTTFACWHDYNHGAVGSGLITYEEVGGIAYATWNGVYSFTTTAPNTFQFQFELATGNVTLVMGSFAGAASVDQIVVGYSVGGPSPGVAPTDLSALTGAITVADTFVGPNLALAANGLPSLGNANFRLDTSAVPNVAPIGILFFGDTQVGIPLDFIGAPGCSGYTNANLTSLTFPVAFPAATGGISLPIPNSAGLIGLSLTCQSAAFTLLNQLGLVTSNGLRFTIGN